VLLVDLDPQAALSTSLGSPSGKPGRTVYELLLAQCPGSQAVLRSRSGPDLIPASIDLAAAELELAAEMGRERVLADALAPLASNYDFIIIDCPPSLGLLTVNALVAAQEVLVPLQCEYLAMRALNLLLRTIERVRGRLNPDLELAGILVTMFNGRTVHAREVLDEVRASFGDKVFPMVVGSSVRFKESPAAGLSILDYARTHDGARAYRELAKEVLG
jgi:chromosome partitioning protein